MTGQLDGHASNPTAARMNQHALVGAEPSDLHQSLPRRQRNQRKGGGFFKRQVGGFEGGGAITPLVDKVFRLDEVRDALAYSESGRATGKVVIKVV